LTHQTLVTNLQFLKMKFKNTMKEKELMTRDVEVTETEADVVDEEVIVVT